MKKSIHLFEVACILLAASFLGSCNILGDPVTGVALDQDALFLEVGMTANLAATVKPQTAEDGSVTWESSNPSIVSVSSTGAVQALALGEATITAITVDGGFKDSCDFIVTGSDVKRTFNAYNMETDTVYSVPATLRGEGEHVLVYAEDARLDELNVVTGQATCDEFDLKIYDMMRTSFGNESDVDSNGKVIILLEDILDGYTEEGGGYVAGYFDPTNEFDSATSGCEASNEADMLYLDVYPQQPLSAGFYSTIAHEFQHMINFNNTYIENLTEQEIWINEGLSSGAEYLYTGAQVADRINYYNADPTTSIRNGNNFFVWNGYWENTAPYYDVLADYSSVYLFFQWLQLHANNGTGIYKEILDNNYRDYRTVTAAASTRIDASLSSWETLMRTWQVSNIICLDTGPYGYLGAIGVGMGGFYSTGGQTVSLSPGEGLYCMNNETGTFTPGTEGGALIRYAGIPNSGDLDIDGTDGYTGVAVLTFNSDSNSAAADQTGYLAGMASGPARRMSLRSVALSRPLPKIYPISVNFSPAGGLSPLSHKPAKKANFVPGLKGKIR